MSADIRPDVVQIATGASSLSQGCSAQTATVQVVKWDQPLPDVTAFVPPVFKAGLPL